MQETNSSHGSGHSVCIFHQVDLQRSWRNVFLPNMYKSGLHEGDLVINRPEMCAVSLVTEISRVDRTDQRWYSGVTVCWRMEHPLLSTFLVKRDVRYLYTYVFLFLILFLQKFLPKTKFTSSTLTSDIDAAVCVGTKFIRSFEMLQRQIYSYKYVSI